FQQAQAAQSQGRNKEKDKTLKEQETQAQIAELTNKASKLMSDGKFKEANVVWQQINDLDPDNLTAQAGIHMSRIRAQEQINAQGDRNQRDLFLDTLNGDPGPTVNMQRPTAFD